MIASFYASKKGCLAKQRVNNIQPSIHISL